MFHAIWKWYFPCAQARLKKKRCEQLCDAEKSGGVGAELSAHEKKDFSNCEEMVMVVHPNRGNAAWLL